MNSFIKQLKSLTGALGISNFKFYIKIKYFTYILANFFSSRGRHASLYHPLGTTPIMNLCSNSSKHLSGVAFQRIKNPIFTEIIRIGIILLHFSVFISGYFALEYLVLNFNFQYPFFRLHLNMLSKIPLIKSIFFGSYSGAVNFFAL